MKIRPVPPTMKVRDLGGEFLFADCPRCQRARQMTDTYLARRHPPDRLLVEIVARMYCQACSRPGARVYAVGTIHQAPTAGGFRAPPPARNFSR